MADSKSDSKPDSKNPGKPGERRFRRALTPFLCQEMLYDYATELLDADRKRAVEEYLPSDRSCQEILEFIRIGLESTDILSKSEISNALVSKLSEAENAVSLGHRYSSWKEWPDALRWSVGAVGASVVVAFLIVVIPWSRLHRAAPETSLTVAAVANPVSATLSDDQEIRDAQESQPPEPEVADADDSGDSIADNAESAAAPAVKPAPTTTTLAPVVQHAKPAPPAVVAAAAPTQSKSADTTDTKSESAPAAAPAASKSGKPKGYVYRGFMNIANLEEATPQITEQIRELGGEKAGEVELGWRRGGKGSYYHFTLPEANQEKLMEVLKAYGPVRVSKDPHTRVMPEGQVRYILWVEPK